LDKVTPLQMFPGCNNVALINNHASRKKQTFTETGRGHRRATSFRSTTRTSGLGQERRCKVELHHQAHEDPASKPTIRDIMSLPKCAISGVLAFLSRFPRYEIAMCQTLKTKMDQ
jgi:hypothetical protein